MIQQAPSKTAVIIPFPVVRKPRQEAPAVCEAVDWTSWYHAEAMRRQPSETAPSKH
jgi:hypothetical protein